MIAVLLRGHLVLLEIMLMFAYAAAVMSSNALGGWLAGVVPEIAAKEGDSANHEGAKLSAWTQVGLFLGNGLMAGLATEGLHKLPLMVIAPLLGALVMLPAAIFPWIPMVAAATIDSPGPLHHQMRDGSSNFSRSWVRCSSGARCCWRCCCLLRRRVRLR